MEKESKTINLSAHVNDYNLCEAMAYMICEFPIDKLQKLRTNYPCTWEEETHESPVLHLELMNILNSIKRECKDNFAIGVSFAATIASNADMLCERIEKCPGFIVDMGKRSKSE